MHNRAGHLDRSVPTKVVVLGSGIAGYSAARAIKGSTIPVSLTMVSEEPDPTYSACIFAEYISGEIPREQLFLKGSRAMTLAASEWRPAQKVTRLDLEGKGLCLETGEVLPFDRLILATGSRAFVPRISGTGKGGVFCLKTLADADGIWGAVGEEAVVVGSGPVGLEVAVALRARGWQVTVIELLDRVLPRLFPPVHSQMVHALLEKEGIRVVTGEGVKEIVGGEMVEAVKTDKRTLPCQLILLGIGMRPEVSLAEKAGIRLGSTGGIAVDEYMQTSDKDVYACGDCVESVDRLNGKAGLNMLWGNAKMQGKAAGMNCLGGRNRYPGALNITTLKLGDTVAASIGETALGDSSYHEVVRDYGDRFSLRLVVSHGLIKGVQGVGPQVDLSIFLNMMLNREKLDTLREFADKRLLLVQKPWLARLPEFFRE